MERFKFRVWNKLSLKFLPESFLAIQGDGQVIAWDVDMMEWSDPSSHNPDNSIIVIQHNTGFKDRKDQDIYEGDIVDARFPSPMEKLNGPGVIYWSESGGYWMMRAGSKKLPVLLHQVASVEVIGNILQDPDLLEIKKDE